MHCSLRDRSSASGTFGTFYQKYRSRALLLVVLALAVVIWRKNVVNFSLKKFEAAQTTKKVPKVPLWSGTFGKMYQKYRKQMNYLSFWILIYHENRAVTYC